MDKVVTSDTTRKKYETAIFDILNEIENQNMGERIHNLRKDNNLTLSELGKKLGVQSSAVSKWEKGRVTNIPSETLNAMAKIFGCSTDYIINGTDDAPYDVLPFDKYLGEISKGSHPKVREILKITEDLDDYFIDRLLNYANKMLATQNELDN